MTAAEIAPLLKLGRAARLQLVTDLWDSIALEDAGDAAVSEEKGEELRRRRAALLQRPESGLSWDEVQRRARARSH